MTGRLRLTGGTLARRLIAVPAAAERGTLRPTSDKVREALFSILASRFDLEGMVAADLCCGSGALGFEALSRGAARCTFVDSDKRTIATVGASAADLGVTAQAVCLGQPIHRFVVDAAADSFDLVFCDPPYALPLDAALRSGLARVVAPGGVLVLERAAKSTDAPVEGLSLVDERRYGDTRLSIWQRQEAP